MNSVMIDITSLFALYFRVLTNLQPLLNLPKVVILGLKTALQSTAKLATEKPLHSQQKSLNFYKK